MTDEVTEMPRCCSRRIQSEVACRAALRPLTVPAIWMAPPKSSSFSVSVVLPAPGCEMIANVRRRRISAVSSGIRLSGGTRPSVAEQKLQHGRILAAADGLVIAAPRTDLLEAQRLVQADGAGVRRAHFEECFGHPRGRRTFGEEVEQPAPDAAAAKLSVHTQVENVRLACAHAHDAVAHHFI